MSPFHELISAILVALAPCFICARTTSCRLIYYCRAPIRHAMMLPRDFAEMPSFAATSLLAMPQSCLPLFVSPPGAATPRRARLADDGKLAPPMRERKCCNESPNTRYDV